MNWLQISFITLELLFAAGLWQFLMSLTKFPHQRRITVPDLLPLDTITYDSDHRGLIL